MNLTIISTRRDARDDHHLITVPVFEIFSINSVSPKPHFRTHAYNRNISHEINHSISDKFAKYGLSHAMHIYIFYYVMSKHDNDMCKFLCGLPVYCSSEYLLSRFWLCYIYVENVALSIWCLRYWCVLNTMLERKNCGITYHSCMCIWSRIVASVSLLF